MVDFLSLTLSSCVRLYGKKKGKIVQFETTLEEVKDDYIDPPESLAKIKMQNIPLCQNTSQKEIFVSGFK